MPHAAAQRLVESVVFGFEDYRRTFREITRRAERRFMARAWVDGQRDARHRILLYDIVVRETLARVENAFGRDGPPVEASVRARELFADWARRRPDCEIAETFYNSVVRRLNGTVGVDPSIEFVGDEVDDPPHGTDPPLTRHPLSDGYAAALDSILGALPFSAPWHERDRRTRGAAALLRRDLGHAGPDDRIEVLEPVFYRNKGAYLVGRVVRNDQAAPLVLALLHPPEGLTLDAVLTTSDEASVVFGFTRSYFHADIDAPRPVIDFLRTIMPLKRVDELYTAIGFNRHGKTEFYRTLRIHLRDREERFTFTPGKEGLVMIVFTLPGLNVVFKVIRDQFGHPKKTSPQRVKRNYGLVFMRDRVGRLADPQEFERLELPRQRFDPEVLGTLLEEAGRTVRLKDGTVVIEHLYTQRRVRPLDLHLDEVDADPARRATLDFGQAIKDLAAADLFPGDMLLKNFGVTRHGRVIFYDYDEVAPLDDCNFRNLPPAAYPEAELGASPHFYVAPDDVFPEEWRPFLGPRGPLRSLLHERHAELFDPAWWRDIQARLRDGEVVDFFPYDGARRLG